MKKLATMAFGLIAGAAFASPTVFPYDTSLTTRIETNGTVAVEGETVTLTGIATPETDTVASLVMTGVVFTAIDSEDWSDFVQGLSGAAMLTVRSTDDANAWYGYTNGVWAALDGGPAIDLATNYDIRISFDKTAGNAIRYSAAKHGDALADFTLGGNAWLAQGNAATQLQAIDLKGNGSTKFANLASGARAAYAEIGGVDQTYSFDYSNVVFDVAVGKNAYGPNAKLKVTLSDGITAAATVEQTLVVNATNSLDFTGKGLVPGRVYDCRIEVVADNTPSGVYTNGENMVSLGAAASWFGFGGGAFTNATAANCEIVDSSFQAEDEDCPVVVTPQSSACSNSTSVVDIYVDYSNFAVTSECSNAQSALCLTEDGWKCLAGGEWIDITNVNVSTAAGRYSTRAEFDYTVAPGKVRFSVLQEGEWLVMKHDDSEWFQLSGGKRVLEGTSFYGSGKVGAIAAAFNSIEGVQPTVKDGEITLEGSTDADLSKIDAGTYTVKSASGRNFNMKWTDKGNKFAKVENGKLKVISGTPANGLASYDSFALGLDAETATSKPVLDSAQNASSSQMTFKVPNVTPNTDAADVTMKIVTLDSPSATTGTETDFENGQAVIDLPDGVKYYKVKISIKTK